MKKKRILILYTMAGHGHLAAAKGIQDILQDEYHIDLEDPFASFYDRIYRVIQLRGRVFWNTLFKLTDEKNIVKIIHHLNYTRFRKRLHHILKRNTYDMIISTHGFLVSEVEKSLKREQLDIPFAVYITDPVTIHRLWLHSKKAVYFVPLQYTVDLLQQDHIPADRIKKVGWILPKTFYIQHPKRIEKDALHVLVIGGGNGVGIHAFVQAYAQSSLVNEKVQITVVCGKNQALIKKLQSRYAGLSSLHVMGYIDNMAQVMTQFDIVAGKAGTAVMFEAFACGKPVLFTSKVLQQEIGNTDLVRNKQLGWIIDEPSDMIPILKNILQDRKILEEKQKGIETFWNDQKKTREVFKETVQQMIS